MVTLDDMADALDLKQKEKDKGFAAYGKVIRVNADDTYQVSLNGSDTTVKCARLTGAHVGDVVLVTVLNNGYAVVTGCVGGDTDAEDAQNIALDSLDIAIEAQGVAEGVNEHFWYDNTGAHVTEDTQEDYQQDPSTAGGNTLITSQGMAIRKGTTELASFGASGTVIGETANDKTRTEITNNGMQIIQKVSGNDVSIANLGYGPGYNIAGTLTDDPYYTLGQRNTVYHIGNYSVVEGVDGHAMAYCSHAEGYNSCVSTVDGIGAHAEGYSCNATWKGCHAEGYDTYSAGIGAHSEGYCCQAAGKGAHAGGYYTLADSDYQTVIGKYNSPDMNDTYALIIGNGTGSSIADRSDAVTVDWSGNVVAAGNVTAANIGAKQWMTPAAVSCQSGKWYKVAEVTLDPGLWLIDCNAIFPNTNTTGIRQIRVTTATFTNGTTTAPASYANLANDILVGAATVQYPQSHFPVNINSQTTFRLAAYQSSGSTVSVIGRMYATRLK